jgi:hypothetical protein
MANKSKKGPKKLDSTIDKPSNKKPKKPKNKKKKK